MDRRQKFLECMTRFVLRHNMGQKQYLFFNYHMDFIPQGMSRVGSKSAVQFTYTNTCHCFPIRRLVEQSRYRMSRTVSSVVLLSFDRQIFEECVNIDD